jgi:hypothetical protein
MKYLSFQRILLVIPCIGLFFYSSCKKDDDISSTKETIYYNLTPEQLAQSPYFTSKKYDTLSFFNAKGDTFTFNKVKTDTSYNSVWVNDLGNDHTKIYMYQYLHNTYQTLKGDGRFEVWHYFKNPRGASGWIEIEILNRRIEYSDKYLTSKYNEFTYYDSLSLKNMNFFNVVKFYWYDEVLKDFSQWNYANSEDGIFATIQTSTNDTLILVKK